MNTIVLSMGSYPENKEQDEILEKVNMAFSFIFFIEMILKLIGFGVKGYFRDPFNTFDSVIVGSSLVDFILMNLINQQSVGGITALRTFRLLRLFKLAKSWKRL